jgi:hypothetical protein
MRIDAVPVRTPSHVVSQPFRSVGVMLRCSRVHLPRSRLGVRSSRAFRCSHLSEPSDLDFSREEDKHHWKCPMYPANFRVRRF